LIYGGGWGNNDRRSNRLRPEARRLQLLKMLPELDSIEIGLPMLGSTFEPEGFPDQHATTTRASARGRRLSRRERRRRRLTGLAGIEQLEIRTLLSASPFSHGLLFPTSFLPAPAASALDNLSRLMFGMSTGNIPSGANSSSSTSTSSSSTSHGNRQTAPAFTSVNSATFTVGTNSTFTVTATGSPTPTLEGNGLLPNGVSFDDATGLLSGMPLPGTGGTYNLTFAALNGVKPNAIQNFVLIVDEAPSITSTNGATFAVGTNGSFTVTAKGFPAPTFSESGTLPAGLTFNSSTGVLSGTPQAGTGGTFPLVFTASNGVGTVATQQFTLIVDTAPKFTSVNSTTFTVGTPGTFTVTATGMPAPTLEGNGILPNGVVFDDGTGLLSGTPLPGTGGTYVLTFAASNGASPDALQTFILTVDATPAIVSANSTTFAVGAAGTFSVIAHGFPAPTLTESGTLPTGVSFNAATGLLSGTPQLGAGGIYPLEFTASNGVGTPATQAFTLIVDTAPAFTSTNATTFTAGTNGTFTVTASGVPSPTFSESGALPNGVSFNTATGVLSGTPSTGTGGTYNLTFTAANGISPDASQSFVLTVDQAPAITSANAAIFTAGALGTFDVTASGFPTSTFVENGILPAGVTFTNAGVLSGTALSGTTGTYPLTISAVNGVGPGASQSFTLMVVSAPLITSANSATFIVGTADAFDVTVSGTPTPSLSESGTLPNGLAFNTQTDEISGTPATGTGGTYTLTFTASNGVSANSTQTFTLIVNETPAITSTNIATFTVGTPGSFTLTANGFPAPTFNEAGMLPNGLGFSPTGVLSGTPLPGPGGTFTVTFTPVNSVGVGLGQIFTIVIDQAPAITSANSTVFNVGTPGNFAVTASGFPNPSFSETGALPAGVSFNPATGLLSGTPQIGSGGSYPLTITASNGVGTNATEAFTLVVNEIPQITSTNSATFTVGTNGTFTVTAGGFPTSTFTESDPLPHGLSFNSATGVLSGTPLANTGGTYTLHIFATNAAGPGPTQIFTLIVVQPPAITSANNATFTVGTFGSFNVTATGFPAPTFAETGALPAGVTFNDTTGLLSGTPDTGTAGTYTITILATNGVDTEDMQTFTLTVSA
jgi:large repetitive protein